MGNVIIPYWGSASLTFDPVKSIPWRFYHDPSQEATLRAGTHYERLGDLIHDSVAVPASQSTELRQPTEANQPEYEADHFGTGLHGIGLVTNAQFPQQNLTSFFGGTFLQPCTRILVVSFPTTPPASAAWIVAYLSSSARQDVHVSNTGQIGIYAGSAFVHSTYTITAGDKKFCIFEYNGANSNVIIQGTIEATGNPGPDGNNGIRLGFTGLSAPCVIGVHAYIDRLLTTQEKSDLLNYYNTNYGTS